MSPVLFLPNIMNKIRTLSQETHFNIEKLIHAHLHYQSNMLNFIQTGIIKDHNF